MKKAKLKINYTDDFSFFVDEVLTKEGSFYRNKVCGITKTISENKVLNNPDIFEVYEESKLEVGKWYQFKDHNEYALYNGTSRASGFLNEVWINDNSSFDNIVVKYWKLADIDKVKKLLLNEAKRRYPIGSKFKSALSKDLYLVQENIYTDNELDIDNGGYGYLFYDGVWAEIVEESKKNVVEVEIPNGYYHEKTETYINSNGFVKGVYITKQPTKSCKTCLFKNRKLKEPCNYLEAANQGYCKNHKNEQDLSNTKIWIGDNLKLSELVQKKAFKLGWSWVDGSTNIYDTKMLFFWYDKDIATSPNDKKYFNENSKIEIIPQDLGIKEEEYEVKLVIDGKKLYSGDKYYHIVSDNSIQEEQIPKTLLSPYNSNIKRFLTKEAAEKWLKNNTKLYLGNVEVEITELDNVWTEKGFVSTENWLAWYDKLIRAKNTEGVTEINLMLKDYLTVFSLHELNSNNSIGCIKNVTFEQVEKITNRIKEVIK